MKDSNKATLFGQSMDLLAGGSPVDAIEISYQLVKDYPSFADGWLAVSQSAAALGKSRLARNSIYKALSLDPNNAGFYVQLGRCFRSQGHFTEALETAKRASQLETRDAVILDAIGTLYAQCGEYEKACTYHLRALELQSENSEFQFNAGTSLQATGRIEEAQRAYERTLQIDPKRSDVHLSLARLQTQSPERNHIPVLLDALKNGPLSSKDEARLCYALAKEYEDTGDDTLCIKYLNRGARIKRSCIDYDIQKDVNFIDYLIDTFDIDLINQVDRGHESNEPIFIIGMPRSGTTLVERILGSHKDVFGAGELHNFRFSMIHESGAWPHEGFIDRKLVESALKCDPEDLGKRYVASTRPRTGHTRRFVDKLPMNALCVGLIQRALPNARILQLVRHPLDVCFSNYKVLFKRGYEYSYDLQELGQFYTAYSKLMSHWQRVLPGRILQIDYENLVSDQESQTRRLLSFCQLDWDANCMRFYKDSSPTPTASAAQVRRPLYRTSVGRWKCFENELEPLISQLQAAGIYL